MAIHTLGETRLDPSGFEQKYRHDETGRTAYDAKIPLKIVLLGYARGLVSTGIIEQACRENVVFIALAGCQQLDYSTVATFVSSLKDEILPLCRDVPLVCQEIHLLGGIFFALDGLKLPSNASQEWSATRSELHRKKARLEAKVKELLKEHVQEDNRDKPPAGPGGGRDQERQMQRLQKQAERIERWLQENKGKCGTTGQEISSNLTDNESAKMKTAHRVIQGYNSQALIDAKHQVTVPAQAVGRGRDHRYAAQGRYWPRRKRFALEDFHYEEAIDHYRCPQGKRLRRIAKKAYGDGVVRRIYVAEEQDCQYCPMQLRCLTARGGKRRHRRVPVGVELSNFSRRMTRKVDGELGRKIYPHRVPVAEPIFANIRTHKRLDRFTLRGEVKGNIQWFLSCMVHNIEKITNYGST